MKCYYKGFFLPLCCVITSFNNSRRAFFSLLLDIQFQQLNSFPPPLLLFSFHNVPNVLSEWQVWAYLDSFFRCWNVIWHRLMKQAREKMSSGGQHLSRINGAFTDAQTTCAMCSHNCHRCWLLNCAINDFQNKFQVFGCLDFSLPLNEFRPRESRGFWTLCIQWCCIHIMEVQLVCQ